MGIRLFSVIPGMVLTSRQKNSCSLIMKSTRAAPLISAPIEGLPWIVTVPEAETVPDTSGDPSIRMSELEWILANGPVNSGSPCNALISSSVRMAYRDVASPSISSTTSICRSAPVVSPSELITT